MRPANSVKQEGLAEMVKVSLIEVCEVNASPGTKPLDWRLMATYGAKDAAMAWRAWLAGIGSAGILSNSSAP